MKTLVTGGAGFIGSNFIKYWLEDNDNQVLNYDKLTYAGNLHNLDELKDNPSYKFEHGDICNEEHLLSILDENNINVIVNFAAESHVDRSINGPKEFIDTNIMGTFNLLEASLKYWNNLESKSRDLFRFIHVSTDEVYGTLQNTDLPFTEKNQYKPNSPYSASKAASDHLVRAYYKTYSLPVITTNCSNNYGPFQFPEKLIPLVILNALNLKNIPIYGDGRQIRDWLYVKDHCKAISSVIHKGDIGEVYNIGGNNELTNIEVVTKICSFLDKSHPRKDAKSYKELITYVKDRPGHDIRYAIDSSKIFNDIGWKPEETFESGFKKTIEWYLDNKTWTSNVLDGNYIEWTDSQYNTNNTLLNTAKSKGIK